MSFPYADTGARDEIRSVGWSDIRNTKQDVKNTTYVRDYKGTEPALQGYGQTFKTGLITDADISKLNTSTSQPNKR
jgi:hypothetical protein